MKLLKTLSVGFVAVASLIGSAHASTINMYITGSTAFRAIVDNEEAAYLSSGITYGADSGKSIYNGTNVLIQGTDANSNTVIFHNFWSGSLAGVVDLGVGNKTISWASNSGVTSTNPLSPSVVTTPANSTIAPDVAMTDAYFGTVATEIGTATSTGTISAPGQVGTGPAALSAALSNLIYTDAGETDSSGPGNGATAANVGSVGAVTFEPLIGNIASSTTEFSGGNLSTITAQGLIGTGFVSETQITGNATKKGNFVYWVGRNEDSGTRIAYLSESGISVLGNPNQYEINSATSAAQYPVTALTTEPTITWGTAGHSGYVTGGNVATALSTDESNMTRSIFAAGSPTAGSSNSGKVYFGSIMGINDEQTVTNRQNLTWDGVAFSAAAVADGSYSLWENEHMYYIGSLDGGSKQLIADKLAGLVYANGPSLTISGVVFAGCDVSISSLLYGKSNYEGSTLIPNY